MLLALFVKHWADICLVFLSGITIEAKFGLQPVGLPSPVSDVDRRFRPEIKKRNLE